MVVHDTPALTARRAATRRDMLAAAEEQFADLGFAATTPADIAAAANIGRTTFYEYFTDMEDLLAALVEARLPEVTADLVADLPREAPPRAQFAELAKRMVEFASTDHVFGVELHRGLPTLAVATQERIAAAHAQLSGEFARVYLAGVAAGELREMPIDLVGVFVQDLVMATARKLMAQPDPRARLDELSDELVGFLLQGLGPG